MRVLVVGAAGKTGRAVVDQAVKAWHHVTAFLHSNRGFDVPGVTIRVGDAADPKAIDAAISGQDAVIDTVGGKTPYRRSMLETTIAAAIVAAMQRRDVPRLIVTSSIGVGGSLANCPFVTKLVVATYLRGSTADKTGLESSVRDTGHDWVITRPAVLTDQPATGAIRVYASGGREQSHTTQALTLVDARGERRAKHADRLSSGHGSSEYVPSSMQPRATSSRRPGRLRPLLERQPRGRCHPGLVARARWVGDRRR